MVGLVVLLWACGIMPGSCAIPGEPWLPTLRERLEQQQRTTEERKPWSAKDKAREAFVKRWLELRMEKETAERLARAQEALLESERRRPRDDAERQAFLKRWLEIRMERAAAPRSTTPDGLRKRTPQALTTLARNWAK